MDKTLPPIPAKRYFAIGEVSELCGVKPYVLRYWEQEFTQLKPMKRSGNRRYYQHHEVLLVRRIRELLYDQGFTINGARHQLADQGGRLPAGARDDHAPAAAAHAGAARVEIPDAAPRAAFAATSQGMVGSPVSMPAADPTDRGALRRELTLIRELLVG